MFVSLHLVNRYTDSINYLNFRYIMAKQTTLNTIDRQSESGIIRAVCSATGLQMSEILAHSRRSDLVRARKICAVCMSQMLEYSPQRIGEIIDRDRCTVIFHLKGHDADMVSSPKYRKEYREVCEMLQPKEKTTQNK